MDGTIKLELDADIKVYENLKLSSSNQKLSVYIKQSISVDSSGIFLEDIYKQENQSQQFLNEQKCERKIKQQLQATNPIVTKKKKPTIKVIKDYTSTPKTPYQKGNENEEIVQDKQQGKVYKYLSKSMLRRCKEVGKSLKDSKFIGEYMPEMMQHMFQKQEKYCKSVTEMEDQNFLLKRRLWKMVEVSSFKSVSDDYYEQEDEQQDENSEDHFTNQSYGKTVQMFKNINLVSSTNPFKFDHKQSQVQIRPHTEDRAHLGIGRDLYPGGLQDARLQQLQLNKCFRTESSIDHRISNFQSTSNNLSRKTSYKQSNNPFRSTLQGQVNSQINTFNDRLRILNDKIQENLNSRERKVTPQFNKNGIFHKDSQFQMNMFARSRHFSSGQKTGLFLESSMTLNQYCDTLGLLSQTLFCANHLLYLFFQRHPQLMNGLTEWQQLFPVRMEGQMFFTEMLQCIIIAAIFVSAKFNEIYHPGLMDIANQFNPTLSYDVLLMMEGKMQQQLVLIEFNFLNFDLQIKWLNFVATLLGWIRDQNLNEEKLSNHCESQQNIRNKFQNHSLKSQQQIRQSDNPSYISSTKKQKTCCKCYNITLCQFILQIGLINIDLYKEPISKKVGTALTIYLKYWFNKSLDSEIIKVIWEMTRLTHDTYERLEHKFVMTIKYCEDKRLDLIKDKYFGKGLNKKIPASLVSF